MTCFQTKMKVTKNENDEIRKQPRLQNILEYLNIEKVKMAK
jgi:hypothetical protein